MGGRLYFDGGVFDFPPKLRISQGFFPQ